MDKLGLDFSVALDRVIDEVIAAGGHPAALSMPAHRRLQLEAAVAKHDLTAPAGRYRGLQIRDAFRQQETVAVIDEHGRAHVI